uniref:Phorbol-ester/DAG-type domain-containing protein n=1 Tax=Fagus sylvatica TaxID=28930 RepID=A0A2N9I3A2_FAGSY
MFNVVWSQIPLPHKSHKHQLFLSSTSYRQSCSSCGSKEFSVFRCPTCEFALDFKCATLPLTTRYKQHEHPFTLYCTPEDDSGEYYCDICEEERDPKHWFYYCADCNYPAHLQCILGKYPDCKFGDTYKYLWHPHRVTFIKEMKDPPPCDECHQPCEELIYQCTQCNFNIHGKGDCRRNLRKRLL